VTSQATIEASSITMNDRSRPLTDWLLLAGFCGFLFFFGLAHFGLIGADEPRYAQVAREMLARHDWITPTLGGKPWLEKPALYYWQAMIAYRIFGVSDWAARLPSAVDATVMVLAVYLFLRRFRPGFQLDGALMTASAAGVIGFARAASTDMPLAASFTIALLAWYGWYERGSKRYLAAFYFFLGVGSLAKGPVAPCLAAAIILFFSAAKGELKWVRRTLWAPGILIFCVVTLPWYVAVQLKNPEFFRVFILEHNLARFGTNLYRHEAPFWYYLPIVLLGLFPWTMFVVSALVESTRAWWAEQRKFLQSENAFHAFLLIWLLLPLVFFSFSRSKLPGYIVPALPAGTLLLAEYLRLHIIDNDRPGFFVSLLHAIVAAAPLIPALMISGIVFQHRLPWGRTLAFSAGFAAVLAAGIAATLRTASGLRMLRFVTLVPVVLAVVAVLRLGAPSLDAALSARPIAAELGRLERETMPLAVLQLSRETEFGLQFYRNQEIARYEAGQIPSSEHLLLAPEGWQGNVATLTGERRVSYLGSYAAQGVDFYWVAAKSGN
jgi:4-amino-4-deoxy-L-arabinose transferase-like glycosyltransferase